MGTYERGPGTVPVADEIAKRRAIIDLAAQVGVAEAAAQSGCSKGSIYNWRNHPDQYLAPRPRREKRKGAELQRNLWWCQTCYVAARSIDTDRPPAPCPSDPCQCRECAPIRYKKLLARTHEWRLVVADIEQAQNEGKSLGHPGRDRVARQRWAGVLGVLLGATPGEAHR